MVERDTIAGERDVLIRDREMLLAQRDAASARLDHAVLQYNAVPASSSWRITAPLRWLSAKLHGRMSQ